MVPAPPYLKCLSVFIDIQSSGKKELYSIPHASLSSSSIPSKISKNVGYPCVNSAFSCDLNLSDDAISPNSTCPTYSKPNPLTPPSSV